MLKKFLIVFLLITFCTSTSVFAVDYRTVNSKNTVVTGENNQYNSYQNLDRRRTVPSSSNDSYINNNDRYDSRYSIYSVNTINNNAFDDNYQDLSVNKYTFNSFSPIEKLYNGKESAVSGNYLLQVGYEQFSIPASSSSSTTGKFDTNYKLSVGEKVNINSYGDSVDIMAMSGSSLLPPLLKSEVSTDGLLYVQGVGYVKAEDRTLSEVENDLNKLARSKYKNIKIKLTVGTGNEFSVFVYGEVNNPGKVYIGANSSVFDALNAAGGVKKTGSLRNISYNGKSGAVDLYNTLFFGNDSNIILKANDKIFVGKIGDTVAIKNGVVTPGIYEIKPNETVGDIIKYAGGTIVTAQIDDVVITGFDKNLKQRTAKNLVLSDANTTKLNNGDTVEFSELYNETENVVTIQGNIKHPATYAYKEGMRLSDILKNEDELLEETFIYQAVIRRVSGKDNSVETIPVFLKEFFAGMNDPVLEPRDVITIYKSTNSQFVDVFGCISTPKHLTYVENMTLSDVMSDIKFLESDITTVAIDGTQSAKEDGNIQLSVSTENVNKLIPAENVAVEITDKYGNTQLYYIYDIMINSDTIKTITLYPEDKIFFRTLRNNEVMKNVKVSGFVKQPGVYTFVKGQKLTDLIKMAGGLDDDADLKGIIFKRTNLKNKQVAIAKSNNERDANLLLGRLASGFKRDSNDQQIKSEMITKIKGEENTLDQKYSGQISLNITSNDLDKVSSHDNIEVQDGDDIYIPRVSNYVSVIGEVYNEQAFTYRKGKTVKYYIKEIGGYTPNANRFRIYKVAVNGKAQKVHMGTKVNKGDTIIVPRRIAGNDWITPICSVLQGLASILVMAFTVVKL